MEVAPASSCVQEVAIHHFGIANHTRPDTCLRSLDTRGAHKYLAIPTNNNKEHGRSAHP
jgi:hypothetical protein